MALNTYNDLLAQLQAWMEDDDAEFQAAIPDIIDLGEKRLLRDLDLTLFRGEDSSATMTIGAAQQTKPTIAAPDLLITTNVLYLSGGGLTGGVFLEQRDHSYVHMYNQYAVDGVPKYFGEVDETTWIFGPKPDAAYTMNVMFLSRPAQLSVSNQTNWLSDNAYDVLFKACLAEAEKFLKDDERSQLWDADYTRDMARVRAELYQQFQNQYDMLGATPQAVARRSHTP